jgi:formamidopyrimidine-DNA glycosylase
MPELPEVETTRRGIAPHIEKHRVTQVIVRDRRLRWPIPENLPQLLLNKTLRGISRRSKYLVFDFGDGHLLVHLGMSGSLRIIKNNEAAKKHDHWDLHFGAVILRYHDPRRFGACLWIEENQLTEHQLLCDLGPEPLSDDFDGAHLFRQSRKRKIAVKPFIMDAHQVVGVGNIYAQEALFLAGVRPGRAAGRVTRAEYDRLAAAIKDRLSYAITRGGTTLRDFVGGDGEPGYFQLELNVYDRADQPCNSCGHSLKGSRLAQRSTVYCPQCQR